MSELSTKPYFIRALHEWCSDNGYTPHILVAAEPNVMVPQAFVQDGQITLNIGNLATKSLVLGNEFIEFQARFGGKTENISIPIGAVLAIFSKESGTGMGFEADDLPFDEDDPQSEHEPTEDSKENKRPHLKIVK